MTRPGRCRHQAAARGAVAERTIGAALLLRDTPERFEPDVSVRAGRTGRHDIVEAIAHGALDVALRDIGRLRRGACEDRQGLADRGGKA